MPAWPGGTPALPAGLERLAVAIAELAADDPAALGDGELAGEVLALRRLADQLDGAWLRRVTAHLRGVLDPDGTQARARARWDRRGRWLSASCDGLVAVDGLLDPEAGEAVPSALAPLARPAGPEDARGAAQRRADALGELARQGLEGGRLPRAGGVRPQLAVTVELASLLAQPGVGGTGGWGGLLPGEALRRVACDATVTRAVVHRHHPGHGHASRAGAVSGGHGYGGHGYGGHGYGGHGYGAHPNGGHGYGGHGYGAHPNGGHANGGHRYGAREGTGVGGGANGVDGGLVANLHRAVALLPPPLGAPAELLDVGRATRVVAPALRGRWRYATAAAWPTAATGRPRGPTPTT
jgi:hypothetical protein